MTANEDGVSFQVMKIKLQLKVASFVKIQKTYTKSHSIIHSKWELCM